MTEHWDEYNARFKALGNWVRNVADPFDLALAKGKEGSALAAVWARRRQERKGYADPEHPFRLQGSADLNSYKMFAEVFWRLLKADGRLGVILPTGIYSDFGTKDLREELLHTGTARFSLCLSEREENILSSRSSLQAGGAIGNKGRSYGVVPGSLPHGRW